MGGAPCHAAMLDRMRWFHPATCHPVGLAARASRGGPVALEEVPEMLPISRPARRRCPQAFLDAHRIVLWATAFAAVALAWPRQARAETLQAPLAGAPIPFGESRVACSR